MVNTYLMRLPKDALIEMVEESTSNARQAANDLREFQVEAAKQLELYDSALDTAIDAIIEGERVYDLAEAEYGEELNRLRRELEMTTADRNEALTYISQLLAYSDYDAPSLWKEASSFLCEHTGYEDSSKHEDQSHDEPD